MAKRRILKKQINELCGELMAEVVALSLYHPQADPQSADEIMTSILRLQHEMLCRVSHTEPGNVKGFYAKLASDCAQRVSEIYDQIDNLH